MPAYTCYSVPAAVVAAGMRVRLVDVDSRGCIDRDDLARQPLESTAAVIVCNLFGLAEPIRDIRVSDGDARGRVSRSFLHYDHRDMGDAPFGYMIENRLLRAARYQIKHGARFIKICATAGVLSFEGPVGAQQFTLEEMQTIVEEAAQALRATEGGAAQDAPKRFLGLFPSWSGRLRSGHFRISAWMRGLGIHGRELGATIPRVRSAAGTRQSTPHA